MYRIKSNHTLYKMKIMSQSVSESYSQLKIIFSAQKESLMY